ncbi:MAG: hypothetical protein ACLFWF_14080 [Alphaproteobacteria bacterium]
MQDILNNLHPVIAVAPQVVSDDTALVGGIIDRQGFDALAFVIATGTLADADATFTVLVEHGDQADLSDAAAVPDAELLGTETLAGFGAADDDETRKVGYRGAKRYVRLTITPAGNTASAPLAAVAILGAPNVAPTANPPQ